MYDHSLQPKQSLLCTIMPSKTKESSQGITRHYIKRVLALSQSFIHKSLIHSGETGHVSPNYSFVISCKYFTLNLYKVLHRRHESIRSGWTFHVSSNYSFVRMPCHISCKDFTFDLYKVLHRCHESIHSGWTIHVSSNYSFVRMPCHI